MMTIPTEALFSLCKKCHESRNSSSAGVGARRGGDSLVSAGSCYQGSTTNLKIQLLVQIITDAINLRPTDAGSFRPHFFEVFSNYTKLSELNRQLGSSVFSELAETQEGVDFLLGGDGVCVAQVLKHLSQVFAGVESFETDFLLEELNVDGLSMKFKRFVSDREEIVEKLSKKGSLRYYQAAYKMESAYRDALMRKRGDDRLVIPQHQYIPNAVLGKMGLQLVRRIPEVRSNADLTSFRFESMISSLNTYAITDTAFLLGFSSEALGGQHAIAISLKAPIHFMDPIFGFGFAETREDLFLFLVNFLSLNYGHKISFSLLEFNPRTFIAA